MESAAAVPTVVQESPSPPKSSEFLSRDTLVDKGLLPAATTGSADSPTRTRRRWGTGVIQQGVSAESVVSGEDGQVPSPDSAPLTSLVPQQTPEEAGPPVDSAKVPFVPVPGPSGEFEWEATVPENTLDGEPATPPNTRCSRVGKPEQQQSRHRGED